MDDSVNVKAEVYLLDEMEDYYFLDRQYVVGRVPSNYRFDSNRNHRSNFDFYDITNKYDYSHFNANTDTNPNHFPNDYFHADTSHAGSRWGYRDLRTGK